MWAEFRYWSAEAFGAPQPLYEDLDLEYQVKWKEACTRLFETFDYIDEERHNGNKDYAGSQQGGWRGVDFL